MKIKFKIILGWTVTIYFLYLTLGNINFHKVYDTIKFAEIDWILFAVLVLFIDYLMRVTRWWLMLRAAAFNPPFVLCARYFFIGNALNNFLPLRAGDVYRIINFSEKSNIPPGAVLATVAVERVFDIISLLILLYIGIGWDFSGTISASFNDEVQRLIKLFIIFFFFVAITILFFPNLIQKFIVILARNNLIPQKIHRFINDTLKAIKSLVSPQKASYLITISLLAWFLESLAYGAVQTSLNLDLPINAMLTSVSFSTISTLLPSSPGYIGTFHYFAALSLVPFKIDPSNASSYALVMHALLWVCVSGFGMVAYLGNLKTINYPGTIKK